MNLVNGKGTNLGINIQSYDSTTRVLGFDLPNNIDIQKEYKITPEYANTLVNSVKEWMSEYAGDRKKIPYILHTDQHGRLSNNTSIGIFKLIRDIVNFDEISACMNLGDVVTDHWEEDNTNEDVWLRNSQLESAIRTTSVIPQNKQINIFGNHDTWKKDHDDVFDIMDLKYLQPYFNNSNRNIKIEDNSGNFVIYDYNYNIKYLCIASWDRSSEYSYYRYTEHKINNEHWDWIIKQMEQNDGFDIIILSHMPLYLDHSQAIDPITNLPSTRTGILYLDTSLQSDDFKKLFSDRKNKLSGSFIHADVTHSYDFSNCKGDLLCALSGHTHYDEYNYLNNSLLSLSYDWFDYQTIFLSLIDRNENKIKVWKISNDNDTPNVQNYILNI